MLRDTAGLNDNIHKFDLVQSTVNVFRTDYFQNSKPLNDWTHMFCSNMITRGMRKPKTNLAMMQ